MRQLIDHLPDHFKNIDEFVAIMNAAQPEIDLLYTKRQDMLENQFIESADEVSLARLEKIFGLEENIYMQADDRRFALMVAMLEKRPTSLGFLEKQLEIICGNGNFEIVKNFDAFEIEVRIALGKEEKILAVKKLLEKIIPANMRVTVDMLYSRYEDYATKTHQFLDDFSHEEIKEEA